MEFGQEAGVHVSPLLGKVPDRRCPKLPVSVPVALLRQQVVVEWIPGGYRGFPQDCASTGKKSFIRKVLFSCLFSSSSTRMVYFWRKQCQADLC